MRYLIIFFIAMLPLAELRIAIPTGLTMNVPIIQTYIISLIGNILPLPFVFYYSQKILSWGKDKKYIGSFLHSVWKRVNKQGKSFRKRLEEVCFLRWFFLLEFLFREQEHGLEFWQQVYWRWILKKALEHASVEFCWRV